MPGHEDIRIGTLVKAGLNCASYIRQILPHGFESVQLTFSLPLDGLGLRGLADELLRILDDDGRGAIVSSLGLYGNPLIDQDAAAGWATLIEAAAWFRTNLVCGFTGRIPNRPVPESLPAFKRVFGPLAAQAEDRGVRLAFENCEMRGNWETGDWNIAHAPAAWEMMFGEIPSPALGLEWEPCHQLVSLIEPLPQLRKWAHKVFHVHGKDATVFWDTIRTWGIRGGVQYMHHRTPGFGDTNWTDVISTLRLAGYHGSIDIEGWHDPVYKGDLEMTGQVRALHYLKQCRGSDYIPNPT